MWVEIARLMRWKLLIASANNKAPHGINYEFDNDYKIPFTKLYKCRTIAERGGFCGKWRGRLKIALSNRPWRVLYTIELPLWANDLGLAGWLGEWLCLELSNPKPINATPQVTIRKPNVIIQPSFHLLPLLPLFCPQQLQTIVHWLFLVGHELAETFLTFQNRSTRKPIHVIESETFFKVKPTGREKEKPFLIIRIADLAQHSNTTRLILSQSVGQSWVVQWPIDDKSSDRGGQTITLLSYGGWLQANNTNDQ